MKEMTDLIKSTQACQADKKIWLLKKYLMDATNEIVSLEQKTDKQDQYSTKLSMSFPENKTENTNDAVM